MQYRTSFIAVLIIIFVVHIPYLLGGFTWLDHGDIEQGRTILPFSLWPLAFVKRLGETGFYRPLVTLTNSLDYLLWGRWAPAFHAFNVLLHLGVVVLASAFLFVFFPLKKSERLLIMLAVGVLPIHWLAVGAISYRQEILYTLGTMLTVLAFSKALRAVTVLNVALVAGCMGAALFAKETAVILIPLLIMILLSLQQRGFRFRSTFLHLLSSVSARPVLFAVIGMTLLGYFLLRLLAVPELWRTEYPHLAWHEAVGTRLYVMGKTVLYLFVPLLSPLSDATPVTTLFHPFPLVMAGMIALIMYLLITNKLSPHLRTLLLLFVVTLLPVWQIVPAPRFFSSHYAYFAAVPASLVYVLFLRWCRSRPKVLSAAGSGVILCWFIVGATATFGGGFRFADDYHLFYPAVQKDPFFREGHLYLGDFYASSGKNRDLHRAKEHYKRSIQETPGYISFSDTTAAMNNLAGVYVREGNLQEAERVLEQLARRQEPAVSPVVTYNRAVVSYQMHNFQKTIDLLTLVPSPVRTERMQLLLLEAKQQMKNNP